MKVKVEVPTYDDWVKQRLDSLVVESGPFNRDDVVVLVLPGGQRVAVRARELKAAVDAATTRP